MAATRVSAAMTTTTRSRCGCWARPPSRSPASAPASAHPASGSWLIDKVADMGDIGRTISYAMSAESLKMTWNGLSYEAKFDGNEYAMGGYPGNTVVSLKRIGSDTIEEIDKRDGKVTGIIRSTV